MQCAEIESSIEPVRECAQVSCRVLAERESVVGAAEAGRQVTERRVDPLEFGDIAELTTTDDDRFMPAPDRLDATEARQTIGGDHRARAGQMGCSLLRDGFVTEAVHARQLGADGIALIIQRDRNDERNLVLGSPPDLAAPAFSAQVGIVICACPSST